MRQHEVAPCGGLDVAKAGQGDKGRVGKALSVLLDCHRASKVIIFAYVEQNWHRHTWQVVFDTALWRYHAGDERLEIVGQELIP